MLKSKISQKGFTIVELLIVIVVIGILAALVLNTFSGVQKRARDTERQTDVNAMATQLEAYYNTAGGYPQAAQIDTEAEAVALLKGIDAGALHAPGQGFSLSAINNPTKDQYGYMALNSTGGACIVNDACSEFTLHYFKEDGGATTKASLNQN